MKRPSGFRSIYAGITVGRLITGFITFKFSNSVLIRAGQVITLAGTLLLLMPHPNAFILGAFVITGLGLAPIFPSMLHETPVRFGEARAGRRWPRSIRERRCFLRFSGCWRDI